jgi:hypothetical protein
VYGLGFIGFPRFFDPPSGTHTGGATTPNRRMVRPKR